MIRLAPRQTGASGDASGSEDSDPPESRHLRHYGEMHRVPNRPGHAATPRGPRPGRRPPLLGEPHCARVRAGPLDPNGPAPTSGRNQAPTWQRAAARRRALSTLRPGPARLAAGCRAIHLGRDFNVICHLGANAAASRGVPPPAPRPATPARAGTRHICLHCQPNITVTTAPSGRRYSQNEGPLTILNDLVFRRTSLRSPSTSNMNSRRYFVSVSVSTAPPSSRSLRS